MIIGFWKPKDKYGIFSNWAHAEFDMEGHHFINSEQAFMFYKAKLFGDTDIMDKILANGNPMIVKNLGRAVKSFDTAVFDEHKYEIMLAVNYEKYRQNEKLRDVLLSTGNAILAEASPKDFVWGTGMTADNPDFQDPGKWKGTSLLGKVLMEVRERLRKEQEQAQL